MRSARLHGKARILALLLIATVLVLFSACGDKGSIVSQIDNNKEANIEKTADIGKTAELTDSIKNIRIEGIAAPIEVMFSGESGITAALKGEYKVSDEAMEADLVAETNGDTITLTESYGSSEVHISNSSLKLTVSLPESYPGSVYVKSVSGAIQFESGQALNNDLTVENISGSVQVKLPQDATFTLATKSTTGKVTNEFGEASGTVGDGKVKLNLTTVTGAISIIKK